MHNIPVLPINVNGFLVFATCHSCAKKSNDGLVKLDYNCPHFEDAERGFVDTVTTLELAMALEAGYRVTKIYR